MHSIAHTDAQAARHWQVMEDLSLDPTELGRHILRWLHWRRELLTDITDAGDDAEVLRADVRAADARIDTLLAIAVDRYGHLTAREVAA